MPEAVKTHGKTVLIAVISSLVPVALASLWIVPVMQKHLEDPHPVDVRLTLARFDVTVTSIQADLLDIKKDNATLKKKIDEMKEEVYRLRYSIENKGGI